MLGNSHIPMFDGLLSRSQCVSWSPAPAISTQVFLGFLSHKGSPGKVPNFQVTAAPFSCSHSSLLKFIKIKSFLYKDHHITYPNYAVIHKTLILVCATMNNSF
jgi:hypothetical protein